MNEKRFKRLTKLESKNYGKTIKRSFEREYVVGCYCVNYFGSRAEMKPVMLAVARCLFLRISVDFLVEKRFDVLSARLPEANFVRTVLGGQRFFLDRFIRRVKKNQKFKKSNVDVRKFGRLIFFFFQSSRFEIFTH